eukprot:RCo012701
MQGRPEEGRRVDPRGEVVTTIFISDLPTDFTERELHNMFHFADGYEQCSVTFGSKVMGFARFMTPEQAQFAAMHLNGRVVDPTTGAMMRSTMAQKQLVTSSTRGKRPLEYSAAYLPMPKVARIPTSSPASLYAPPAFAGMGYAGGMPSRDPSTPIDTLFVSGMDHTTTEEDLLLIFQAMLGYKQLKMIVRSPDKSPFALVQFVDAAHAASAMAQANGRYQMPSGRPLNFSYAKSPLGVPKAPGLGAAAAPPAL